MKKIQFEDYKEPYLNAETLNQIQDNVEEAINEKGSGSGIHIGPDEPTDTDVWIDTDELLNVVGTEVVDSLSGNEINKAPSVRAVNGTILFEDVNGSTNVTLKESSKKYKEFLIEFRINTNVILYATEIVLNPYGKNFVLSRKYIWSPENTEKTYEQMMSSIFYIDDKNIEFLQGYLSNIELISKQVLEVDTVNRALITKVIGYK